MISCSKTFGPYSTIHRAWRAKSHCHFLHGYGKKCRITFTKNYDGIAVSDSKILGENGWIIDFGGMEKIKNWFAENWDHKAILAYDDPLLLSKGDQPCLADQLKEIGALDYVILPKEFKNSTEHHCLWVHDAISRVITSEYNEDARAKVLIENVKIYEHEFNEAAFYS